MQFCKHKSRKKKRNRFLNETGVKYKVTLLAVLMKLNICILNQHSHSVHQYYEDFSHLISAQKEIIKAKQMTTFLQGKAKIN